MKNARERMDVLARYREVGSFRGAAELNKESSNAPRLTRRNKAPGCWLKSQATSR